MELQGQPTEDLQGLYRETLRKIHENRTATRKGEAAPHRDDGFLARKDAIAGELTRRGANIHPEARYSTPESQALAQRIGAAPNIAEVLTRAQQLEQENAELRAAALNRQ